MRPGRHKSTQHWHGVVIIALTLGWGTAMASDWGLETSLEGGVSNEESPTMTLSLHRGVTAPSWLPGVLQPWSLQLSGRLLLMPGRNSEKSNAALILAPALRHTFDSGIFVEGGIGAALFLDAKLRDSELGTAGQFEDRLAVGWPWRNGALHLALAHYSNASIKAPNDGLEVFSLGYRWRL